MRDADAVPLPVQGALPWTRGCLVCGQHNPRGFHLRSRAEGHEVVLDYTTRPEDTGYARLVHGGVVMTLLDEVMTWAAILVSGRMCVAAELTTRLCQPIAVGQPLRVAGWIVRASRRLYLAGGRVTDAAGGVLSEATGKYVPVADARAELQRDDFLSGPDTLPLDRLLRAE